MLKACLVLGDLEVQYKLKNFDKKNLQIISDKWEETKIYLDLTTRLLAHFGFSSKNILSTNALIPIAYYLRIIKADKGFISSENDSVLKQKHEIIKWLTIAFLTGAFGSSSDSTLKSVRDSLKSGKTFKDINNGKLIKKDDVAKWVKDETYQSRKSHLLLLLISPTRYWDDCHQDHLYPASKFDDEELKNYGIKTEAFQFYKENCNSLANLHLLNPYVNLKKSDKNFIDWQDQQNKNYLDSILIPQNIPKTFENFPEVVSKRSLLIVDKIFNILSSR